MRIRQQAGDAVPHIETSCARLDVNRDRRPPFAGALLVHAGRGKRNDRLPAVARELDGEGRRDVGVVPGRRMCEGIGVHVGR